MSISRRTNSSPEELWLVPPSVLDQYTSEIHVGEAYVLVKDPLFRYDSSSVTTHDTDDLDWPATGFLRCDGATPVIVLSPPQIRLIQTSADSMWSVRTHVLRTSGVACWVETIHVFHDNPDPQHAVRFIRFVPVTTTQQEPQQE